MDAPDEIVHQTLRLKILAALRAAPEDARLEFTRLKKITGATDGNLGRQLTRLAEAGYIDIAKDFYKNRPRTRRAPHPVGRKRIRQSRRLSEIGDRGALNAEAEFDQCGSSPFSMTCSSPISSEPFKMLTTCSAVALSAAA